MAEVLTIGQLAQRTETTVSTIRFYEQKGLIEAPARNKSGYRLYSEKAVERVRFIKNCRDLDFPLKHVADLLKLCYLNQDQIDCEVVQTHLQTQYEQVQRRAEVLKMQQAKLQLLLSVCPNGDDRDGCDFIRALLD